MVSTSGPLQQSLESPLKWTVQTIMGRLLQTGTDLRAAFFFFFGYYISPDCDKQIGPGKWSFVFFGFFKKNKSPENPFGPTHVSQICPLKKRVIACLCN